jgi:galactose-1-phosphate uridylyltransferase
MFKKELSRATILDFTDGFKEKSIPIEIRTDRFTGRVSRILDFRWKLPQSSHDPELIEEAGKTCPFCPERIETLTPQFPPHIIPEGRLRFNETTVIPNAFPYCSYCGVAIFSETHYLPMNRISESILYNALKAGTLFFQQIHAADPFSDFPSINWNYMPTSGGSLFHPHFQVIANQKPTAFWQRLLKSSTRYRKRTGRSYWSDLIEFEKKSRERYLFSKGDIEFLTSYSPGGIFGEVLALFTSMASINDVTDDAWRHFASGLGICLQTFDRLHLDNLNMTLFIPMHPEPDFRIQARIMPRILIPPWKTSDVNYFEKGHDESVVIFSPEALASEIRNTLQ